MRGIAFGGDYNPEQWPLHTQLEDIELMRAAGVNLVSLGIFNWALIEPAEGIYTFEWLDEIVDRLAAARINVDLATPTAAPPPWFSMRYPESLPITREGMRIGVGGREHACPSSPAYRRATAGLAHRLAERYADHPAVVMWHVHNEYGAPLGECYCPASTVAFREWLRTRYKDLDELNTAWGTTFWSQRYADWGEIDAPRANHTVVNPAQRLDFARFSSDESLACFTLQRDILRAANPAKPITTNFMTTNCKSMDLWRWAREVDVVSNDHYLNAAEPDNHVNLAMSADLSRSLRRGQSWLLLEHSTGAVSWQPRNLAKRPGEMRRNSLAHVARGSDSVLFFQWRQSKFGAEKFHSAMLPQAGTDSQIWRDVVQLGGELRKLEAVQGTRVPAEVAIVWDWESYWALELDWRPSCDLAFRERVDAYYAALWREHTTVDFVHPSADLSGYRLVVAPSLYLLGEGSAKNLRSYVESGGHLLVSYFSGIVDEHDTVHDGPYPGALREVLGLSIEEFHPLPEGETVALTHARPPSESPPGGGQTKALTDARPASEGETVALADEGSRGRVWSERVRPASAVTVCEFAEGLDAGHPAVTRHEFGRGVAWYAATAIDDLRPLIGRALDGAGVARPRGLPDTLEVVRRGDFLFLLNHGPDDARVDNVQGLSLLDDRECAGTAVVPGGGVCVVRVSGG